jgi:6-phosphofructokinase 1
MNLGILTSGGDCAGLNAVIKGAAQMAAAKDFRAFIIPNGYAGLYNLVDKTELVRLDEGRLDDIVSHLAGSAAGHSRIKIAKIKNPDKYKRIRQGLDKFHIDALVIAGGDDTGSVVTDLSVNGIACVHVPKTMDLDLFTYSVGGDSAVNQIAGFVESVKTTGRSHSRITVVEVFGRYAGHTVFRGGVAADADCVLIPEVPVDFDIVYQHMKKVYSRRIRESDTGTGTYVIVVTEGLKDSSGQRTVDDTIAADPFGHKKLGESGMLVREELTQRIKADPDMKNLFKEKGLFVEGMNETPDVRESAPQYLVRSGVSTALDANFGRDLGAGAVVLLSNGVTDVTVTGVIDGVVYHAPVAEMIKQRRVHEQMIAFYEAMGVCFGREPKSYKPTCQEVTGRPWCYL